MRVLWNVVVVLFKVFLTFCLFCGVMTFPWMAFQMGSNLDEIWGTKFDRD